ncbi:hypothetical protein ACU639_00855 [Streptomyces cynarae]|uniref:hypothetical protein n=1 Tax=Streptomyces cynarae TaxID=2981134 RepID=UPI00406CF655
MVLTAAEGMLQEAHRPPAAGDATTAFLAGRQRTPETCRDAERLPGPYDAVECARVLEAIAEAAV